MNLPLLLLGATASALAVVANLTGSLGAAVWAVVLSIIACTVAVTKPLSRLAAAAVARGGAE